MQCQTVERSPSDSPGDITRVIGLFVAPDAILLAVLAPPDGRVQEEEEDVSAVVPLPLVQEEEGLLGHSHEQDEGNVATFH